MLDADRPSAAAIGPLLAGLALRFALAIPFLRSGLTRWTGSFNPSDTGLIGEGPAARLHLFGYKISDATYFLFQSEFKLHLFGSEIAFPEPVWIATATSIAEIALPVLLILGLFTRLTAFALLIMTGVIQLTVPEGWANFHLPWAAMALALVVYGPGRLSLDGLWARR